MHVVVRADGGPEAGYGHLTRTSALASTGISEGDEFTYLTQSPSEAKKVVPNDVTVVDVGSRGDTIDWLTEEAVDWVVTDSYEIDTEYQRALAETVPKLAVIIDDNRHTLCCDIAINGNVYAPNLDYDWVGERPEFLLGTDYFLLREGFQGLPDDPPPWREHPEKALITFGGSDTNNQTPTAMRAFAGFELAVDVIIGPGFSNHDEIYRAANKIESEFNVLEDPENLPRKMFESDMAVAGTGVTVYELLATGTPVVGVPQVDNQVTIADALEDHILRGDRQPMRTAVSTLLNDSEKRKTLRENGRSLIDGQGARRVYKKLNSKGC